TRQTREAIARTRSRLMKSPDGMQFFVAADSIYERSCCVHARTRSVSSPTSGQMPRVERRRDEEGDPVRARPGPPAGGLRTAVRRSGACGDPEGGGQVHGFHEVVHDHDKEEALLLEEALVQAQADAGGGSSQAVGLPGSGRGSPLMARRVIPPARHFSFRASSEAAC